MSANNRLRISNICDGEPITNITFRWGFVREISYDLGSTIAWDPWPRPSDLSDTMTIGGYYARPKGSLSLIYVKIIIKNDVILSYESSDEPEYEYLEKKSEAILTNVIDKFRHVNGLR